MTDPTELSEALLLEFGLAGLAINVLGLALFGKRNGRFALTGALGGGQPATQLPHAPGAMPGMGGGPSRAASSHQTNLQVVWSAARVLVLVVVL